MNNVKVGDTLYTAYVNADGEVKILAETVWEKDSEGYLRLGGDSDFQTPGYLTLCGYTTTRAEALKNLLKVEEEALEEAEAKVERLEENVWAIGRALSNEVSPIKFKMGSVVRWVGHTSLRPENMTGGSGLHTVIMVEPWTMSIKLPGSDKLWPMSWFEIVEEFEEEEDDYHQKMVEAVKKGVGG